MIGRVLYTLKIDGSPRMQSTELTPIQSEFARLSRRPVWPNRKHVCGFRTVITGVIEQPDGRLSFGPIETIEIDVTPIQEN